MSDLTFSREWCFISCISLFNFITFFPHESTTTSMTHICAMCTCMWVSFWAAKQYNSKPHIVHNLHLPQWPEKSTEFIGRNRKTKPDPWWWCKNNYPRRMFICTCGNYLLNVKCMFCSQNDVVLHLVVLVPLFLISFWVPSLNEGYIQNFENCLCSMNFSWAKPIKFRRFDSCSWNHSMLPDFILC